MIIVEGPDGSGKSTLIRNLGISVEDVLWMGGVRQRTPEGVKWIDPTKSGLDQFRGQVDRYRYAPVAFDRFHLSERIYGPILRGEQVLHDPDFQALSDRLREFRIPVILCLPPFDLTYKNVTSPGRERPRYQTDDFLAKSYRRFSELTPWVTIVYDFTRDSLPRIPC